VQLQDSKERWLDVSPSLLASSESPSPVIETLRGSASMDSLWSPQNRVRGLLTQTIVHAQNLGDFDD